MTEAKRTLRLVGLLALVNLTSGCQLLQDTRPLVVQARDAETKQPIPGARVSISYPVPPGHGPQEISEQAGSDGIARLEAGVPGDGGLSLGVSAKGYHSESQAVASTEVRPIPPLKLFEKSDQRPVQFVIELFADPDPTVDLVLPPAYRGVVKAELIVRPDAPVTPGQRIFTVSVTPAGTAQVVGPSILHYAFGPDFRLRFTNGVALSRRAEESDVGYWWLGCDEKTQTFFVGTLLEYDTYRRTHRLQDGVGGNRQGGAVSGGRGGKHRGGGGNQQQQPPAESTSTGTGSS